MSYIHTHTITHTIACNHTYMCCLYIRVAYMHASGICIHGGTLQECHADGCLDCRLNKYTSPMFTGMASSLYDLWAKDKQHKHQILVVKSFCSILQHSDISTDHIFKNSQWWRQAGCSSLQYQTKSTNSSVVVDTSIKPILLSSSFSAPSNEINPTLLASFLLALAYLCMLFTLQLDSSSAGELQNEWSTWRNELTPAIMVLEVREIIENSQIFYGPCHDIDVFVLLYCR